MHSSSKSFGSRDCDKKILSEPLNEEKTILFSKSKIAAKLIL